MKALSDLDHLLTTCIRAGTRTIDALLKEWLYEHGRQRSNRILNHKVNKEQTQRGLCRLRFSSEKTTIKYKALQNFTMYRRCA